MINKMIFSFNFIKYSISFSFFKDIFYFIYIIFRNIFFTKSSFLFRLNVGWNQNFLIIYHIIKTIFIFVWEQLTSLIYVLKLFSSLFHFLIKILEVFKDIFNKFIGYVKTATNMLIGDVGSFKKAIMVVFSILFISFVRQVQSFFLESFIKIGDLLFKIVLRILDIIFIVLKIWLLLLKKVIIMLSFVLSFLMNFIYWFAFHFDKIEQLQSQSLFYN